MDFCRRRLLGQTRVDFRNPFGFFVSLTFQSFPYLVKIFFSSK